MDNHEILFHSTIEELKKGYSEDHEYYHCLFCQEKNEKGVIYPQDSQFYDAEKYMKLHIEKAHGSVFEYLVSMDKKITGLSEHQSSLLKLFYMGKSDAEVQKAMGIGSSSTIRNHRFVLKEKERQAKMFLVMMELLKEKAQQPNKMVAPHKTAKMVDDRYNITEEQRDKIIVKYFPQGIQGPLKTFDMKEKSKLVVLRELVKRFDPKKYYTEKEVNEILEETYHDYVTLRRYLIEYGFLDRKPNGSQYWVKETEADKEDENMDRKIELKQAYKEMKKEAGVYQVKNKINQKVWVDSTPSLKTLNGKRFQLQMGGHMNKALQQEWKEYGEDAFEFEVLEVLEEKEDGFFDKKEALKKLEEKWLDKLQPYGDKGYNKAKQ